MHRMKNNVFIDDHYANVYGHQYSTVEGSFESEFISTSRRNGVRLKALLTLR